ncbi:fibronectin type 3 and ankyrin repeat domains 1 protein [Chrysoperla carnea]|uniref:fibronectin type 3 and ankyrin repeat domains 1 protein n=1 Tax=Chrysoperla carnea TaxID=189513 RepID=UPI001D08C303|nr:fibronectin type 3 and ankyrin repeat domains 1 protein [Chrysoperla carnea]
MYAVTIKEKRLIQTMPTTELEYIDGGYKNWFKVCNLQPGPGSIYKFRLGIYDGELNNLYEDLETVRWSPVFKVCTENHPFTVAQLNKAIEKDNVQLLKEIIKTRPSILETEDSSTLSPIVKAVTCNNLPIVIHLFNSGFVDIDSPNILTGRTTLMVAVTNQFMKIIKYLVENHADINRQDINGCTPIHYAIDMNNLLCVNYLLDKGVNLTISDGCGYIPLMRAVIMDADYKIVESIYKKWKNAVKIKDNKGLSCIDHSKSNNRNELLQLFGEKG